MDRRQQKSRQAILNAFEELLAVSNYNNITVQQIIDKANVGRTTFYAHFATKDALLEEMCTQLFHHVFLEHPEAESSHDFSLSDGDSRKIVTHILYHLKENGRAISRLITGESSEIFLRYFIEYLNRLVINCLVKDIHNDNLNLPTSFLKNHISSSFIAMVQWWISRGMKEEPEVLCEYFFAIIHPIFKK